MALICPRCKRQVPQGPECTACGIIIEKFLSRQESPTKSVVASHHEPLKAASAKRLSFSGQISAPRRLALYTQLARMIESGLSVTEALRLARQNTTGKVAQSLQKIVDSIENGKTLSSADGIRALFEPNALAILQASEETGCVPKALKVLAKSIQLRLFTRRQIVRACIYPFVLFTLVFFIPKTHLLLSQGLGPYLEQTLLPYFLSLVSLICLVLGVPTVVRLLPSKTRYKLVRRIPVIGNLFWLQAKLRFANHLGQALEAGLPMTTSLSMAAQATANPLWIQSIAQALRVLQSGASLHACLQSTQLFNQDFLFMLAAGERAGRLSDALYEHTQLLQETFQHRLQVTIQLSAVVILLATYYFVARNVISQFSEVMGGTSKQMQQLMKELKGLYP